MAMPRQTEVATLRVHCGRHCLRMAFASAMILWIQILSRYFYFDQRYSSVIVRQSSLTISSLVTQMRTSATSLRHLVYLWPCYSLAWEYHFFTCYFLFVGAMAVSLNLAYFISMEIKLKLHCDIHWVINDYDRTCRWEALAGSYWCFAHTAVWFTWC